MNYLNKDTKLNNGINMPVVGLGTYLIQDKEQGIAAITHAINFGYRMIDTADFYKNHELVREAIEKSDKNREDLFITSKIWNTDQKYEDTIKTFNRILKELNTDYLDLLLVHWPAKNGLECYSALEDLYKQGKVRAIGVSNYLEDDLKELIEKSEIKPMVNQVELHPLLPLLGLQEMCKEEDIQLISWQTMMKGKVGEIPEIAKLAEKYGVDGASIALKWALQQDIIVIPKSVTPKRIENNATLIDTFELTPEEIKIINELGPEKRLGTDPKIKDR